MDSYDKEAGGREGRATGTEGSAAVNPPAAAATTDAAGPASRPGSGPAPAAAPGHASAAPACADRVTPPSTAAPHGGPVPGTASLGSTPRWAVAEDGGDGGDGAGPDGEGAGETGPDGDGAGEAGEAGEPPRQVSAGGPGGGDPPGAGVGIAALSLPYQVVAAVSLAVVGMFACVHLAMAFLHVAPSNTLTKQHGQAVDDWVFPEFEQNWKLFAPNPLQQNIAVHARAEVVGVDGRRRTTGWFDLSGDDGEAIRGNLLPSHVNQNELRRGWDFYVNSHTNDNRPNGLRGQLSERYVRRIAMLRLETRELDGRIERIQLRSATQGVEAPVWSDEKTDTRPYYRVLPWWTVTAADLSGGVTGGRTEADQ
ncbi:DUF5819 family protein [Streptomyces sp. WAC05374]|uniref:DUF5819 family protein n=1 Tax=Streptomyces sp. WAC05374 TaxID=2487420 RepID=UPI00190FA200|nr:DUF5819 family protein [Streptomyces sp. WAC05374]